MKTIISLAAAVFSLSSLSVAAHDMVPAPAQTQDILIKTPRSTHLLRVC